MSDWDSACCTTDQLETLQANLQQAEPLLALCPACKLNFRDFFCSFTCSPDQSLFVSVIETQNLFSAATDTSSVFGAASEENEWHEEAGGEHGPAVKRIAFHVDSAFGQGFYDSCKSVKFGATNGYAMDLIGGGAKNWTSFLDYMGTEVRWLCPFHFGHEQANIAAQRPGLGSPFTINFPQPPKSLPSSPEDEPTDDSIEAYDQQPRSCASDDPSSRCACADCPEVCLELPAVEPPSEERALHCHVGSLSCFNFTLLILYAVATVMFFSGVGIKSLWSQKDKLPQLLRPPRLRSTNSNISQSGYDRLPLEENTDEGHRNDPQLSESLRSGSTRSFRPSEGTSGVDDSASPSASLAQRRLGRGASLMDSDPLGTYQPRTYALNTFLSSAFYKLGRFCAYKPYITIAPGLIICGIANSGWSQFAIEKDPVKLWVAKGSASERNKAEFEASFGPFYRTEQIFIAAAPQQQVGEVVAAGKDPSWSPIDEPVFTWDRLKWWADVEQDIQSIRTPSDTSLLDFCFAPSGEAASIADCVIESPLGYFGDIANVDKETWADRLDECATSPSLCLTPSGMPLNPRLVFGDVPGFSGRHDASETLDKVSAHEAGAFTVTYVVSNTLDEDELKRVEEWEEQLRQYLENLSREAPAGAGVQIAYSTGISLERELNKSTNTDVPIVVFSYLLMFIYVSCSLGGSLSSFGRIMRHVASLCVAFLRHKVGGGGAIRLEEQSPTKPPTSLRKLLHRALLESKFLLGLCGILSEPISSHAPVSLG